jgi:membrane-bound ClpP family serine protease
VGLIHEDRDAMKTKKLTLQRLISAIASMIIEQAAVYAVWRWLLPYWGVNLDAWVVITVMAVWLVVGVGLFIVGTSALDQKEVTGLSTMVGMQGVTEGPLDPSGTVKIYGELWNARAAEGVIGSGVDVIVTGEDGLNLVVKKK